MPSRSAAACVRATSSWWWRAPRPTPCSSSARPGVCSWIASTSSWAKPRRPRRSCWTYLRCRNRLRAGDLGAGRRQGAPRRGGLSGSAVGRRSHLHGGRHAEPAGARALRFAPSRLRFARLVVDGPCTTSSFPSSAFPRRACAAHHRSTGTQRGNLRQALGGRDRFAPRAQAGLAAGNFDHRHGNRHGRTAGARHGPAACRACHVRGTGNFRDSRIFHGRAPDRSG